jgi:predicted amidohydrolase YtcJ
MKADIIILSDAIFDAVSDQPFPGGIAVAGGKIIFVGPKEEALTYDGVKTRKYDYGNMLVTPGLCDSHFHFSGGVDYASESICNKLEEAKSEEDCVRMMVEFAAKHPRLPRYCGIGWLPAYWGEGAALPTKLSLDRYFPEIPVYLQAIDGHSLWVNSKALEESGYTGEFKADYGSADRLANGEFSGLLRESGASLARAKMWTKEDRLKKKMNLDLLGSLNAAGITALSDVTPCLPEQIDANFGILKELDEENACTVRVYMYPSTDVDPTRIPELQPYRDKYNSERLHIAGVKALMDGVTSAFTAAMLEPYSDAPNEKGSINKSEEQFREWVIEANRNGYGVRIHSIGDAATRLSLDCYEASNKCNDNSGLRNAVEHIEVIHPDDIGRFSRLGVIASMQPVHVPLERGEKIYRVGDRSKYEWALNSIMKTGAHLAFGTDCPVTDFNPFVNIYAALTRKHKNGTQYGVTSLDQKVSLPQAIKAYTIEGAYVNNMEKKLGTLEAGKLADLVVFDRNWFDLTPEDILNTKTLLTVFDGKVVYEG